MLDKGINIDYFVMALRIIYRRNRQTWEEVHSKVDSLVKVNYPHLIELFLRMFELTFLNYLYQIFRFFNCFNLDYFGVVVSNFFNNPQKAQDSCNSSSWGVLCIFQLKMHNQLDNPICLHLHRFHLMHCFHSDFFVAITF
jgi:hypothetical protein